METKANHVVIGAFTLAVMFSLFAFSLWIVKTSIDQEFAEYDILFDDVVTGLGDAGAVTYKGVKVGEVTDIGINEANPNQIRVHIRVDAATPIFSDSIAKIDYQGVTGVGFVQISGGTPSSGELPEDADTGFKVIPSENSDLQTIFASAPEIMSQILSVLERISGALNDENMDAISDTIGNIQTITASFANKGDDIEALIGNASAISGDLKEVTENLALASARIDSILDGADQIVNTDAKAAVEDIRSTVVSVGKLADETALAIETARPAIEDFSVGGVQEISRLLVELRKVSQSLDRLVRKLESDGARTLLGEGE